MKLERLIVKNVGRYRQKCEFDLRGEMSLFYGANFSGKSTLARAVYFALTGRELNTGLKPPALASTDAASGTVGLFYQHQQSRFRIYRSTKGEVQIEQANGEKWQRCSANAATLPGLTFQQWRTGCFLHEDELGGFLVQPPASRRDLLNQLLGVESLLQTQELFIHVRRLAKRREKTTMGLQESLRLDGLTDRTVELQAAKGAVTKLEARLQTLQETKRDTEPDKRLRQTWEQARAAAQTRLEQSQQQLAAVRAGFAHRNELAELLQQTAQQLTRRESAIREMERCTEQRVSLTSQLQQVEEMLGMIKGLQGRETCPTCQQPLAPAAIARLVEDYQTRRAAIVADREQAAAQEHNARETVRMFDDLAGKQIDLEQRWQRWQQLEAEIAAAQEELETWETKLAALAPLTPVEESYEKLQQELETHRRQLAELERQHLLYEQQRQAVLSANRRAKIVAQQRLLSEWAAEAVACTVQSVVGISLKKADAEIAACLQSFGLFGAQPQKIDLEKSQLMPTLEGRPLPTLSGSEKTILYLSMKTALSRLMPGADFLVLDDPTVHLDETRRRRLRDYLVSLLPEKQIILFTNDRGFAEQFSNAKRIDLSSS